MPGTRVSISGISTAFLANYLFGVLLEINGMFVKGECEWQGYGFDNYAFRSPMDAEKIYSDTEICEVGRTRGFQQVMVYREDKKGFTTISCK